MPRSLGGSLGEDMRSAESNRLEILIVTCDVMVGVLFANAAVSFERESNE